MTRFALTIAASDPSGGAGIEADLKVFSALKVFGMSAITGITVQGPKGIERIAPTPGMELSRILEIMDNDLKLDAVKVGALVSKENLQIARIFLAHTRANSVLDPLLNSGTGYPLLHKSVWQDLSLLFPLASLLTPNIAEAEILSGIKIQTAMDLEKAGEILIQKGAKAVLIKGGHLAINEERGKRKEERDESQIVDSGVEDFLFYQGKARKFSKARVEGKFHGAGCALSSAIAGYLALGSGLEESVIKAEEYMEKALAGAIELEGIKYLSHIF